MSQSRIRWLRRSRLRTRGDPGLEAQASSLHRVGGQWHWQDWWARALCTGRPTNQLVLPACAGHPLLPSSLSGSPALHSPHLNLSTTHAPTYLGLLTYLPHIETFLPAYTQIFPSETLLWGPPHLDVERKTSLEPKHRLRAAADWLLLHCNWLAPRGRLLISTMWSCVTQK